MKVNDQLHALIALSPICNINPSIQACSKTQVTQEDILTKISWILSKKELRHLYKPSPIIRR
jgi:hypothetical protein